MTLDVQQWKILSICLFPAIAVAGLSLSVLLGSKAGNKISFTLGVMFSAGILLAASLVHSLPHATEMFEQLLNNEDDHHEDAEEGASTMEQETESHDHLFPWASMIFGLTFYLLLVIEAYSERFIDSYLSNHGGGQNPFHGSHGKDDESEHDMENVAEESGTNEISDDNVEKKVAFARKRRSSQWLVAAKHPSVIGLTLEEEKGIVDVDEKQTINPWVAILLLVVLSVHVLVEGLTLGSSNDATAIQGNFIAIVSHKLFGAFSLGTSFLTAGYWDAERPGGRKMFFVLSGVYLSMDVVGLGIGMALATAFSEDTYAFAILQATLGGSFLFVSAVELVPGELEKMRVFKFPVSPVMLALGAGYAFMSLIGKWV